MADSLANTGGRTREWIGPRIIPVFADEVQWDEETNYEPLMMVQNQGETFMSRQYVPAGAPLPDTSNAEESNDYWVHMSNWNAQVEGYREEVIRYAEEVLGFDSRIDALEDALPTTEFDSTHTVDGRFDSLEALLPTSAFDSTNTVDARFDTIEANDWVTTTRIADDNVTTPKIADANVTTAKLADGAVTTAKIADGNVTNGKIANGAVSLNKLASDINLRTNIVGTEMISIGDSYFAGSRDNGDGQIPEAQRMQFLLANQLGLTCHDYSQGGIGFYYSHQGGATHIIDKVYAAIADTSYDHNAVGLIVIGAGRNDTASNADTGLTQAVETVFNQLHTNFPNAKIMFFFNYDWGGRYGGSNEKPMLHNMHVIYRTIEQIRPAVIVDQNSWTWFLGEKQNYDNIHPNLLGHKAFAAKMYNMLYGNSYSESKVYTEGSIQSGLKSGSSFVAQRQGNLLFVTITGQFNAMTRYTDYDLCTIYNCAAWGGDAQTGRIDVLFGSTIVQVKAITDGTNLKIQATPYSDIAQDTTCCVRFCLGVII